MAEHKDEMDIRDKVHIVLRGPDGKVKDERKTEENKDETVIRHENGQQARD